MTYEEIVKEAKQAASKIDVSGINEHIAIQINVTGEGEGAFYIEVSDGKVNVEPYEYYDNHCKITASSEAVKAMMAGTLNVDESLANGSVSVEGDGGKALVLVEAFKAISVKKAPVKKEPAKKSTPVKKEPAKKTAVKKSTAAKKETVKKAAEKKTAATKDATVKKIAAKETAAAKKAPVKKTAEKKAATTEKASVKKAEIKETVVTKKEAVKKTPAKKTATKKAADKK